MGNLIALYEQSLWQLFLSPMSQRNVCVHVITLVNSVFFYAW